MSALLSIVENPVCHCVCFDNFCASYYLLRDLHENNFKALGTICEGRTMKCLVRPSVSIEKRGAWLLRPPLGRLHVHRAMKGQQGRLLWFKFQQHRSNKNAETLQPA